MLEDTVEKDSVVDGTWLEEIVEDDIVDESWLEDIVEDESVEEASVADDNELGTGMVEDDTIEDGMLEDDKVALEVALLDESVPVDVVIVEAVGETLLEAVLELRIDDEAVDDAPLEDGVTEDTAVDESLVEEISVEADPLEMAEEAELATVEETEAIVDAAEDESDDWT